MAYISNQQTNPNDPNQQQGPSSQPSATGMSQSTPQAPGAAPMQSQRAQQPKGSGRFTNIQKYLQANQGAGQRLAGGIGRKIEANVNPQAQKAQTQAQNVREGIQSAQGILQQGQQLQQQVGQQDFDVVGFAAQQPNVQQFTQFRTGQAIDENALRQQAQANQMQAMQAQQAAQGFGTQLGTEGGRAELLKQTFSPTRNYSIGQQRLDNLFLSRSAPEIENIQRGLQRTSQDLGNVLIENQQKQKAIQDLATQEAAVAQGLTGAITEKDKALEAALTSRIGDVNTQREAERQKYLQFAEDLLKSGRGEQLEQDLNADLLKQTGLDLGSQTFNVLKDPTLDARNLLNISDRQAQTIQDVARQEDVERYRALAALGGFEPQKLTQAGQLEAAAGFKQGEGSLKQRVDTARKNFLEEAMKTVLQGQGAQNWKSKDALRGRKGTERATASLNLANVLGGDYTAEMTNQSASQARDALGQMAQVGVGNTLENLAPFLLAGALNPAILSTGLTGAGFVAPVAGIANMLPGVFGDPNAGKQQRARAAAQTQANQDVMNKLNAFLRDKGFDQYLSSRGVQTGTTNLEDYGYGQSSGENRGRFRNLVKLPEVK